MSTELSRELNERLTRLREEIDRIDTELVGVLASRLTLCRQIAEFKKHHGIPMMQPARVASVLVNASTLGARHGLDPEFMRRLYQEIIDQACRLEDQIIGGGPSMPDAHTSHDEARAAR